MISNTELNTAFVMPTRSNVNTVPNASQIVNTAKDKIRHRNLNECYKLLNSLKNITEIVIKFKNDELKECIQKIDNFETIINGTNTDITKIDSLDSIYTLLYPIFHGLKSVVLEDKSIILDNKYIIFTNRLITKSLLCFIYGLLEYKSSLCSAINTEKTNLKNFELNIAKTETFSNCFVYCQKDIKMNISCDITKTLKMFGTSNTRNITYYRVLTEMLKFLTKHVDAGNFTKNIDEFDRMLKNITSVNSINHCKGIKKVLDIEFEYLKRDILNNIGYNIFEDNYKFSFKNVQDDKTRSVLEFLVHDTKIDCGRGPTEYYKRKKSNIKDFTKNDVSKRKKRVRFENDNSVHGRGGSEVGDNDDDDDYDDEYDNDDGGANTYASENKLSLNSIDEIPKFLQKIKLKIAEFNDSKIDEFIDDKTKQAKTISTIYTMIEELIEALLNYYKTGIDGYINMEIMEHEDLIVHIDDKIKQNKEVFKMLNSSKDETVVDFLVNFNIQEILLEKTQELYLSIMALSCILSRASGRNITYSQIENSFNFFSLNFIKTPIFNIIVFLPEMLVKPYIESPTTYFNFYQNFNSISAKLEVDLLSNNANKSILYFTFCNLQIVPIEFFLMKSKSIFKSENILTNYRKNFKNQLSTINEFLNYFIGIFLKKSSEFDKSNTNLNMIKNTDLRQHGFDASQNMDDYVLGISNFGSPRIPALLINSNFYLFVPSI